MFRLRTSLASLDHIPFRLRSNLLLICKASLYVQVLNQQYTTCNSLRLIRKALHTSASCLKAFEIFQRSCPSLLREVEKRTRLVS